MKEIHDFYYKKAKAENYPARSVYKLKELDAKFRVFKKGMKVLDLGACPGSWSLGCAEKIGPQGVVLACDIQESSYKFPSNIIFLQEDIFSLSENFKNRLKEIGPFDVVMSDMAPATTGSRFTDQARSYELANSALELAKSQLKLHGAFIVKIFMSPEVNVLQKDIKKYFKQAKSFKPKSSRAESKEIFLIGIDFYESMDIIKN